jgi:hypothetical protein
MNKLHRDPFRSAHVLVQRKLFADLSLLQEARDENDRVTMQIARAAIREDRKRLRAIKHAHDTGEWSFSTGA